MTALDLLGRLAVRRDQRVVLYTLDLERPHAPHAYSYTALQKLLSDGGDPALSCEVAMVDWRASEIAIGVR